MEAAAPLCSAPTTREPRSAPMRGRIPPGTPQPTAKRWCWFIHPARASLITPLLPVGSNVCEMPWNTGQKTQLDTGLGHTQLLPLDSLFHMAASTVSGQHSESHCLHRRRSKTQQTFPHALLLQPSNHNTARSCGWHPAAPRLPHWPASQQQTLSWHSNQSPALAFRITASSPGRSAAAASWLSAACMQGSSSGGLTARSAHAACWPAARAPAAPTAARRCRPAAWS